MTMSGVENTSDPQRPEFEVAKATPELIGNAMRRFGAAVIREGVDRALIDQMHRTVAAGFQIQDEAVRSGQLNNSDRAVLDDRLSISQFVGISGGAPQLQQFLRQRLIELMQGYLGPKIQLMAHRSVIRRQKPSGTTSHTPFHQDGGFLERGLPIVVCWVALDPCGVHAPGMELVTEGVPVLLPITQRPSGAAYDSIELEEEMLVSRFGREKLWHPEFQPGDVCLMTETAVHRTHVTPEMTETRTTLLLRFTSASAQTAVA